MFQGLLLSPLFSCAQNCCPKLLLLLLLDIMPMVACTATAQQEFLCSLHLASHSQRQQQNLRVCDTVQRRHFFLAGIFFFSLK